jgi:hypothetical protein
MLPTARDRGQREASMESFWANVRSPGWWIGVVVVGLLLNFFAAYLIRGADWLSRRLSRRWGERTAAKTAARNREIEELRGNHEAQVMARLDSLDDKVGGIFGVAGGTAIMVTANFIEPQPVLLLVGLLVVLAGMGVHQRGVNRALIVKEARK